MREALLLTMPESRGDRDREHKHVDREDRDRPSSEMAPQRQADSSSVGQDMLVVGPSVRQGRGAPGRMVAGQGSQVFAGSLVAVRL